jgi:predicted nucleic acid-binding protein
MPNGLSFVDTNIFVYRASSQDNEKRERAILLLDSIKFGLSTQVLQEFYVTAIHPKKLRHSHDEALEVIEALLQFPIHIVDLSTIQDALGVKEKYVISYWDAVVIASAKAMGCETVYTEDLNDGQSYDGVRAVNPFTKHSKPR